jgi:hypothetical protein
MGKEKERGVAAEAQVRSKNTTAKPETLRKTAPRCKIPKSQWIQDTNGLFFASIKRNKK